MVRSEIIYTTKFDNFYRSLQKRMPIEIYIETWMSQKNLLY